MGTACALKDAAPCCAKLSNFPSFFRPPALCPGRSRAAQIRVHLAHAGHAILGDDLYGVTGARGRRIVHPRRTAGHWAAPGRSRRRMRCPAATSPPLVHARNPWPEQGSTCSNPPPQCMAKPRAPPAGVQGRGLGGTRCTLRPSPSRTHAPGSPSPCAPPSRQTSCKPWRSWGCSTCRAQSLGPARARRAALPKQRRRRRDWGRSRHSTRQRDAATAASNLDHPDLLQLYILSLLCTARH